MLPSPRSSPNPPSDEEVGPHDKVKYLWDFHGNKVATTWLIRPPQDPISLEGGKIGHVVVQILPPKNQYEKVEATLTVHHGNDQLSIPNDNGEIVDHLTSAPQLLDKNLPPQGQNPTAATGEQLYGHDKGPLSFPFYVELLPNMNPKSRGSGMHVQVTLAVTVRVEGVGVGGIGDETKSLTCHPVEHGVVTLESGRTARVCELALYLSTVDIVVTNIVRHVNRFRRRNQGSLAVGGPSSPGDSPEFWVRMNESRGSPVPTSIISRMG